MPKCFGRGERCAGPLRRSGHACVIWTANDSGNDDGSSGLRSRNRQIHADSAWRRTPKARATFNTVAKLGLPVALRAL